MFQRYLADYRERGGVPELLAARRQAEPVDGHYHFAEFESLGDVANVDRAHALIRCPASGDGEWETYLREGEWVPGREPRDRVVLPVGRENVERLETGQRIARRKVAADLRGGVPAARGAPP
jgi:hypothetical protein